MTLELQKACKEARERGRMLEIATVWMPWGRMMNWVKVSDTPLEEKHEPNR